MRINFVKNVQAALRSLNNAGISNFTIDDSSISLPMCDEPELAYLVVREHLSNLIVLVTEGLEITYYEGKDYGEEIQYRTDLDTVLTVQCANLEQTNFLAESLLLAGITRQPNSRLVLTNR